MPNEIVILNQMVRKTGRRKLIKKGYDIIRNNFFVDGDSFVCFENFSAYYEFLHGDIYDNACYYGYTFLPEVIERYSIDLDRLNFRAFINTTIDDFTIDFSKDEQAQYQAKEIRKKKLKRELNKFYACTTYREFQKRMDSVDRFEGIPKEFFLSNFIFHDTKKAFNIVMKYINHTCRFDYENKMCLIYEPRRVLAAYKNTYYAKETAKRYKENLQQFVAMFENGDIKFYHRTYFDEGTHFWVFCLVGEYESDSKISKVCELERYFETFQALMEFRKNDLSYCDLSKAIMPDLDLSKYKIDDHTILPIQYQTGLTYSLEKLYDRTKACFVVNQNWSNTRGISIKSYHHVFHHFCDFVYFLKGDLSDADLLFCDGLANIDDFTGLNLKYARLQSKILDKLGVRYEIALHASIESFPVILRNEEETSAALLFDRKSYNLSEPTECQKIFYVSDLHLFHRLLNAKCCSVDDVIYIIQKVIDTLLSNISIRFTMATDVDKNLMLIGGDVASDFTIFRLFISMLRKTLDERHIDMNIVFVLGNHELWDFPQCPFEEIVAKYRYVLAAEGMFLLQNNIIFKYHRNDIGEISTEELGALSPEDLHSRLNEARIILFGGLAFAGYDKDFNANQRIYRDTINRRKEIEETKKFEMLYHRICADLADKRVIVFTHMPQKDWCADSTPQSGFVYVNGHTHRNYFYDDGAYRIYADNQIGYKSVNAYLKYFDLDDDYDMFTDYKDGIYELNREQYIKFYHGKNIMITFNRKFCKLFMLKKNDYYMFVLQSSSGKLTILNGGAIKSLEQKDIKYYFDRMDEVIAYIKSPLDKFMKYQQQISEAIKAIGGSGTIHGSIVDIDYFNHVFVNPLDYTITPYYAEDIVYKIIFDDMPTLLQNHCPGIYKNYLKQIKEIPAFASATPKTKKEIIPDPLFYLDTDIYRASRIIKKMQKLNSNILSIWIEPVTKKLYGKEK